MIVVCNHCGQQFKAKPREQRRFCSKACYHAHAVTEGHQKPAPDVEFDCAHCGDGFTRIPSELKAYRKVFGKDPLYCSRKCAGKGKRTNTWPCTNCGAPIHPTWVNGRTTNRRQKLCGTDCISARKLAFYAEKKPLEEREMVRMPGRHGYIRLFIPRTATSPKREMLEHRYIMEQMLGRPMRPEETVHHMNGQRTDNRPENLSLRSGRHGPGGDVPAMLKWAREFIALYPQFDAEGNLRPVDGGGEDHANPALRV